jgi:hypothetical protein
MLRRRLRPGLLTALFEMRAAVGMSHLNVCCVLGQSLNAFQSLSLVCRTFVSTGVTQLDSMSDDNASKLHKQQSFTAACNPPQRPPCTPIQAPHHAMFQPNEESRVAPTKCTKDARRFPVSCVVEIFLIFTASTSWRISRGDKSKPPSSA